MSIALLTVPEVSTNLQNLWRWFSDGMSSAQPARTDLQKANFDLESEFTAINNRQTRAKFQSSAETPSSRPLRIVRVLDANHSPANVGRMFMSGRMADVCAELDRLADCEAACH